ncbi:MAG: (5-formylfuran-3-yl)methyl phosphate synthase, partial [Alphaproteobacteria bacterium]|nr:(5-formylfuran-3-yl)methyl phosphate synthase [Alphaproteobacteria bacterium]
MRPAKSAIRFLASVRSVEEARCVAHHGADIVDCKDPDDGALGSLDIATIARIRAELPEHVPVSATVGDDAAEADDLTDRIGARVSAGADFVKIGFARNSRW